MNERRKSGKKSIFERNGFYTALYASIAVVMVVAVGITYSSLSDGEKSALNDSPINYGSVSSAQEKPAAATVPSQSRTDIVSSQPIEVERGEVEDILPASNQKERPVASAATGARADRTETADYETADSRPESVLEQGLLPAPEESVPASANMQGGLKLVERGEGERSVSQNQPETQGGILPESNLGHVAESNAAEEMLADPVFNTFTGNEDMDWPVAGEVVMDFSMESLVYDKTLNQYRTNDGICIAAGVGEQVKAAADGVVRSIYSTREMGNAIVIEHGNGWFTTYSQLQNGILVEEGDVVSTGQVIGGVGEPSIYYTLLGSHLAFKVVKDDAPVNPGSVLALN